MKNTIFAVAFALVSALSVSAITVNFKNQCDYREQALNSGKDGRLIIAVLAVWAAVGSAPWGNPDPSIAFGKKIGQNGGTASYKISNQAVVSYTSLCASLLTQK
jgi:hypothetical protein